jgi:PTH1 family peptidyl-tRNA hydrolase
MSLPIPTGIKACIGLGNPGSSYYKQRHSIGFRVIDELACHYQVDWKLKDKSLYAEVNSLGMLLIKPQTFMNSSGEVMPFLQKKGIRPFEILVIHDELEKPFGFVGFSFGASHKGHNGLKSIIAKVGPDFWRLKVGIGRPLQKESVPDYVLQPFSESFHDVEMVIKKAARAVFDLFP